MIRKLIMLALTAGLAKKLYDKRQQQAAPFPTSGNNPVARNS